MPSLREDAGGLTAKLRPPGLHFWHGTRIRGGRICRYCRRRDPPAVVGVVAGVGGTSDDSLTRTTADCPLDIGCVDDRIIPLAVTWYVSGPALRRTPPCHLVAE